MRGFFSVREILEKEEEEEMGKEGEKSGGKGDGGGRR